MTEPALSYEYLAATGRARHDLVLLHGWASTLEVWRPLLAHLRDWANVTLIDLPGCSTSTANIAPDPLEKLQHAILKAAPDKAVYVGWSLGGQLAAGLAQVYPERVSALVTVCSNPHFVERPDWPGMTERDFARFREAVATDGAAALRRFDSLQTRGSCRSRSLRREIAGGRQDCNSLQLQGGLELLGSLDLRATLAQLSQPQLHCFASHDALVPPEVRDKLTLALADVMAARFVEIPDVSHVAVLEAPAELGAAIHDFLSAANCSRDASVAVGQANISPVGETGDAAASAVAKTDVAQSFSRAAVHYDSAAQLQREVGTSLLGSLDDVEIHPQCVLDLGCGTGFFVPSLRQLFPQSALVALDLAFGMVDFARSKNPGTGHWLVGDAESLPLASNSIDLVFSSLAIQWCFSPERLFAELARVLKSGGRCVFTSLGPDTLKELRSSWAAVDSHQHVNEFLSAEVLKQAVNSVPGVHLTVRAERFGMEYDRVGELLGELKTLGAHNMNSGRHTGLTGRKTLQGMLAAYESWRNQGKLPATYEVLFGVLEKA